MSATVRCPLCSWFAAKSFKVIVRHIGAVHAHDPAFYVSCAASGCPRTYRNYHSYKKHLYKKHRFMLDEPSQIDSDRATPMTSAIEVSHAMASEDEDVALSAVLGSSSSDKNMKKEAALFVLKSKHIHKVSQSSVNGLLCDFSSMLESRVHSLETRVLNTLRDVDSHVKTQVKEIFHSGAVVDPFKGLETEHRQKIFYKNEFNLVVSLSLL